MKKIIYNFLRWLSYILGSLLISLMAIFILLPQLNLSFGRYHCQIEQLISRVVKLPLEVNSDIKIGNKRLIPVLELRDVVIYSPDRSQKLFQVSELGLGVDLIGSLLSRKIKLNLLLVNNSKIKLTQNQLSSLSFSRDVDKNEAPGNRQQFIEDCKTWLLSISEIKVSDLAIEYAKADGQIIQVTDLFVQIKNENLWHFLKLGANVSQQSTSGQVGAEFKLRENYSKFISAELIGKIELNGLMVNFSGEGTNLNFKELFPESGNIELAVKNSSFKLGALREILKINEVDGKISWCNSDDALKINFEEIKLLDRWLWVKGAGSLTFLDKQKLPHADFAANFKLSDIAGAKAYYSPQLISQEVIEWLDRSLINSKACSGKVTLQGDLSQFPFEEGAGEFLVEVDLKNATLKYDPDWPQIAGINGKLIFNRRAMAIAVNEAVISDALVKSITVAIDDLESPTLKIVGTVSTEVAKGLSFIKSSPLNELFRSQLEGLNLSGLMRLNLKLVIPLAAEPNGSGTRINGEIELRNGQISFKKNSYVVINKLFGNVSFDENQVIAKQLSGLMFDKSLSVSITTLPAPATNQTETIKLAINGTVGVDDLEAMLKTNLSECLAGSFKFNGVLTLTNGNSDVYLTSDLVGLEVKLPAPYYKALSVDSKLEITSTYSEDSPETAVKINYMPGISANLIFNQGPESIKLTKANLNFGAQKAELPKEDGISVFGNFDVFRWEAWKVFFDLFSVDKQSDVKFVKAYLRATKANWLDQVINNFSATIIPQPQNSSWLIQILGKELEGSLKIPFDQSKLTANFKKVYFKDSKTIADFNATTVLPLNLKIEKFVYNGYNFGKVMLVTEKRPGGIRFNKLTTNNSELEVNATGEWINDGNTRQTSINGQFKTTSLGAALKKNQSINNVIGGAGITEFSLVWPQDPFNFDLLKVKGKLSIRTGGGRIINLDQKTENKLEFGKVLSLLSVQLLPRRLSSGFSDVTTKGFSFDKIKSDFVINEGRITINKFLMSGGAADIIANGHLGLERQDCDLMVNVIPHVTSSIPVVAAIAAGPIVGAVSLVADKAVSKLAQHSKIYRYHVTGSWDKPIITDN